MVQRLLRQRFLIFALLTLPLLTGAAPAQASETISCQSKNFRYKYCSVNTQGWAKLVDQRSNAPCVKDRSWGYDRRGVWVDDGCAGRFRVGREDQGGSSNGGGAWGTIPDGGAWGTIPGGGAWGTIPDNDRHQHRVPAWAVGTFKGYNDDSGDRVRLRIHPNGKVVGNVSGLRFVGHYDERKREINVSGQRFKIERERGGLRTVQVGNRNNVVYYDRVK